MLNKESNFHLHLNRKWKYKAIVFAFHSTNDILLHPSLLILHNMISSISFLDRHSYTYKYSKRFQAKHMIWWHSYALQIKMEKMIVFSASIPDSRRWRKWHLWWGSFHNHIPSPFLIDSSVSSLLETCTKLELLTSDTQLFRRKLHNVKSDM